MTVSKFYNVQEVADMLGVHRTTVRRDIDRRAIATVQIGKRLLVTEEAIGEYLQRNTTPAQPNQAA